MRLIISVISGKGGSGKSLVATSLALSLANEKAVQLLDCNVDGPDAEIFLKPSFVRSETVSVPVPKLDERRCDYCGKCAEVCAYNAIVVFAKHVLIVPELCRGCGACGYFCSAKAISEEEKEIGVVESGSSDGIGFVHGRLNIGETMAAPLIRKIKEYTNHEGTVIIDVPSAKSCPIVWAIQGSDFCLLVTEPTPFGLNELTSAVNTVNELNIPCGVVLNRAGVGDSQVEEYCHKENIPIMLTIPLDTEIAHLYSKGIALVEGMPEWRQSFVMLSDKIRETVSERDSSAER